MGETIFYPYVSRRRGHGLIAHELAHFLLQSFGLPDTEEYADYLGAALLVPMLSLLRDLECIGFDLEGLMAIHHNASATLLVTRIAEAVDGRATLFRRGRVLWQRPQSDEPHSLTAGYVYRTGREHVVDGESFGWPLGRGYVVTLDV